MASPAGGDFSMAEHRVVGVLYLVSGFLGILGNILIIAILRGENAITGCRSKIHVQFAIANILIVAGIPLSGSSAFAGSWLFGDIGCQMYGVLTYTGGMGAVTFAGLLCIQRYYSISLLNIYDMSGRSLFLSVLGWIYSVGIAIGPVLGWNSYVIESSGTACGLNWHKDDQSHRSLFITLPVVSIVMFLISLWSLRTAFSRPTPEKIDEKDWFTNNQLNWIAMANLIIVTTGFAPYGFFAIWALFNHGSEMTMLASVIPPVAAKLSTVFYPVPYIVASKKFREAFAARTIGICYEKKDK
ncbi:visual pigment-like receptor peropsin [Mercenaria mercenaria]|uniref:visual pigment-like receptor peropsin n=1 Tax=Mercenaria mercenaria TaxID=6596 RepID=UPI00234EAEED|nr:visual pigment-like receptor peropsin [Mercenaria mercenaria]